MKRFSIIKKIFRVISAVLLYLFLGICLVALVLTILSRKDSTGAVELFGYRMLIVSSDSMAECEQTDVSEYEIQSIPLRSMVFVESVPTDAEEANEWYANLAVGDVLTFRYVYTNQVTITHRITSITPTADGYIIELAGDNKNSDSEQMTQIIDTSDGNSMNYVLGKVVGQNYPLGFFTSLLKETVGLVLIVIVPCFIVLLLEVIKIVSVLNADKKQRAQEEQIKKDSEIEELKRRLAILEGQEGLPKENEPCTEEPSCPLQKEPQAEVSPQEEKLPSGLEEQSAQSEELEFNGKDR